MVGEIDQGPLVIIILPFADKVNISGFPGGGGNTWVADVFRKLKVKNRLQLVNLVSSLPKEAAKEKGKAEDLEAIDKRRLLY